ncbi:MAG TPA: GspE/PulE family protein [Patescibacteria group bacterium]|jgi:type IV pilus assembly protein PilB
MPGTFIDTFTDSPTKFREALVELKLLTAEQVENLRVQSINSGQTVEHLAQEMGLLSEEDAVKAWGKVMGLPYVDLRGVSVKREILQTVPERVAKNYAVISFEKVGKRYQIAMADPRDVQALEALEFVTKKSGLLVDLHITSHASIKTAVEQYGSLSGEVNEVLKESEKDVAIEDVDEDVDSAKKLEKIVSDAPIAKAIGAVLKYAVKTNASDIHIEPTENEIKVRYRLDGVLQNTLNLPRKALPALVSRIKILSNLKIDESRVPQDGRFSSKLQNREIDFRVSTFPTVHGEKVVMRLLDKAAGLKSLEDIGVSGRGFDKMVVGLEKPYGMTLVTGPTGSGKSTTLYASLSRLNDVGVNIVTLEDPVEYSLDGVNQSQINPQIGYSFASGLRSILRQDPDIVMVGEIRDQETADMAVNAALTGHIVLSTLHTNDAAGALPRMVDMGVEPFLLASSINTLVAQRLTRRICEYCKKPMSLNKNEKETIEEIISQMPKEVRAKLKPLKEYSFVKGAGCDRCGGSGYKGRIGIFEVLPMSDGVKEVLLANGSGDNIADKAIEEGMVTMQMDGVLKVLAGQTTLEEVMLRTKE